MLDKYVDKVAEEIGVDQQHVKNVVKLLGAENTVPFIARYHALLRERGRKKGGRSARDGV